MQNWWARWRNCTRHSSYWWGAFTPSTRPCRTTKTITWLTAAAYSATLPTSLPTRLVRAPHWLWWAIWIKSPADLLHSEVSISFHHWNRHFSMNFIGFSSIRRILIIRCLALNIFIVLISFVNFEKKKQKLGWLEWEFFFNFFKATCSFILFRNIRSPFADPDPFNQCCATKWWTRFRCWYRRHYQFPVFVNHFWGRVTLQQPSSSRFWNQ